MTRIPRRPVLVAALAVGALAGGPAAGAYKWVDEDGNVHYTQTPPPDRPATEIEPPPEPANAGAARRRVEQLQEQTDEYLKSRREAAQEAQKREQDAKQRRENCEWARNALVELQTSNRIYDVDDSGNRTRVGEQERQARIEEVQKQIEEYCN